MRKIIVLIAATILTFSSPVLADENPPYMAAYIEALTSFGATVSVAEVHMQNINAVVDARESGIGDDLLEALAKTHVVLTVQLTKTSTAIEQAQVEAQAWFINCDTGTVGISECIDRASKATEVAEVLLPGQVALVNMTAMLTLSEALLSGGTL